MGAFKKIHPDVKISLKIGDTQKIIDEILADHLEMGIVGAENKAKQIVQERLIEDQLSLVVAGDHRWADQEQITMQALSQEPFIVREKGSGTLESIQHSLMASGNSLDNFNIVAEMGSTAAVIQGIKNHVGVSILSSIAVHDDVRSGNLRTIGIQGLNLKRGFQLTRRRNRTASPLCRAFVDFIRSELKT
jgi:DNA-binding transcriptional LysR family regulator